MKLDSLHALYVEQLRDLYDAENQLVKALPKMAKTATAPQLQSAFQEHLAQTQDHVRRIEQVFQMLNMSPKGKHCKAMEGLIAEGEELMKERADKDVLDAGLIAAAQRVEHYEIAGYGCARTYAMQLGRPQEARLLEQTLNEEKTTDEKLTMLAEQSINIEAAT